MLETQLVRARNRVADVLDDCRRMIDDTLAHAELGSIAVRILYQLTSPMDRTLGPEEVERRRRRPAGLRRRGRGGRGRADGARPGRDRERARRRSRRPRADPPRPARRGARL